ncbi:MAG: hypothetical protein ACLKAN_13855 [Alkaliphilus sp.]
MSQLTSRKVFLLILWQMLTSSPCCQPLPKMKEIFLLGFLLQELIIGTKINDVQGETQPNINEININIVDDLEENFFPEKSPDLSPARKRMAVSVQAAFTDTSLAELLKIYPETLYYPSSLSSADLQNVRYLQRGDLWIIAMDFLKEQNTITFTQEITGEISFADKEYSHNVDVSFYQIDTVKYTVLELNHDLIKINWFANGKKFHLSGDLTVKEGLSIASSIKDRVNYL